MQKIKKDRLKLAAKYIDSWLNVNYRDSRLPGIVAAIQHDGELVLNRAYGYADAVNKVKLTPDHVFRIASHSKTFTATAIFQLYEAGKLRLDDTISSHLGWFTSRGDEDVAKITIRHFLNHTSGLISNGLDTGYWRLERSFPSQAELKDFAKSSKMHVLKTGEHFKYSNYAYAYLGMIIEAVSGMTYEDYVTENIIDRLGLADTYPELSAAAEKKLAKGHTSILFNSERELVDHADTMGMSAATGFCSTASDLCKYFAAHCYGDDSLISDMSKREMQHGYWPAGSAKESYGLGMGVHHHSSENTLAGHSGGFPGFVTDSLFEPEQELIVSALTNAWDGPAGFVVGQIINIIDYFNTHEGKIENAQKYEGRFCTSQDLTDIVSVNGKLIISNPRFWGDFENAQALEFVDKNTLRIEKRDSYNPSGEEVIYDFDPSGRIKSIVAAGTKMLPEADYLKSSEPGA